MQPETLSKAPALPRSGFLSRLTDGDVLRCVTYVAFTVLVAAAWMRSVNWDEFFFLSHVHAHLDGRLDRPMQTGYVHAFGWLAWIPGQEMGQIFAARLVMTARLGITCFSIYRVSDAMAGPRAAGVAVVAFLTSGFVLAHGASFRAEPIAASLLMTATAIVMTTRMAAFQIAADPQRFRRLGGEGFGAEWARAARATASQSTLGLDGVSSARLGTEARTRDLLVEGPREVLNDLDLSPGPASLVAGHDGYAQNHGLIHVRRLDLGVDGRALAGEDVLTAEGDADKRRFARALERLAKSGSPGIAYTIRFHLHPDVDARLDLGGRAVSLPLRSGEVWIFRQSSAARMSLDPSVYLEKTRATPVASLQIVLSGRATTPVTAVKWNLAKAQDTPDHLRDLYPDAAD